MQTEEVDDLLFYIFYAGKGKASLVICTVFCEAVFFTSLQIRQNAADLSASLRNGAALLAQEYPGRVLTRLDQRQFWKDKDLAENDWNGLAAHFLAQYFS